MIDYARYDAILEIREQQKALAKDVRELEAKEGAPREKLKELRKLLEWVGTTWDDAYVRAAKLLKGSQAFAGADAMKASYLRVVRCSRTPERYDPHHANVCRLGWSTRRAAPTR